MKDNFAFKSYLINNNVQKDYKKILSDFQKRYKEYRSKWHDEANKQYASKIDFLNDTSTLSNPLCIDIEVAAICDLGCPHCFREHIITPDKIMSENLFKKIIDSISKLDVPSIKLNWRGEPLLNPKLSKFIKYAKTKNILDIIINTNATRLDEKTSISLINSGLDQIIFSFDGGTEETYNKMRPGRFRENNFKIVYSNIKKFAEIKKKLNTKFPTTKIQMVLTKDTRDEINNFYSLFQDIVDDVTVLQYNERGGTISSLNDSNKKKINDYLNFNQLPLDTPYMVTADNKIYVSSKRKPCEQLFQRLMITYDGRVGMCCHDWGAQHCIGYVDNEGFKDEKEIDKIEEAIISRKKGFELLKNATRPKSLNNPEKKVESIESIWHGKELNKIRNLHSEKKLNDIEVCKDCTFKDTYSWTKI